MCPVRNVTYVSGRSPLGTDSDHSISASVNVDSTRPATCRNSQRNGSRCFPCVHPSTMLKARNRFQGRRAQSLYCAVSKASFRRWGWPASARNGAIKRLRPTAPASSVVRRSSLHRPLNLNWRHSANGLSWYCVGAWWTARVAHARRQASGFTVFLERNSSNRSAAGQAITMKIAAP